MNAEKIIAALGGTSEVARLCECSPQAVSQWFGNDPVTGTPRTIPKPRLLFLKAVHPEVFADQATPPISTPAQEVRHG